MKVSRSQWNLVSDNVIISSLDEISSSLDNNRDPEVVLKFVDDELYVKLSNGVLSSGKSPRQLDELASSGTWQILETANHQNDF